MAHVFGVVAVVLAAVVVVVLDSERARLWWERRRALRALAKSRIAMPEYALRHAFTAEELTQYEARMAPLRLRRRLVRLADQPPVVPASRPGAGAAGPHRKAGRHG